MLDSQRAHIHEAVDAVGQARLLALVQRVALDCSSHALIPAGLSEVVCSCVQMCQ